MTLTYEQAAELQRELHERYPFTQPEYLPADFPEFEDESWTTGGPDEDPAEDHPGKSEI